MSEISRKDRREVSEFLWNDLKDMLSRPENPYLHVRHLGTFAISYWKMREMILLKIRALKRFRNGVPVKDHERMRSDLKDLLIMRNKLANEYYKTKSITRQKRDSRNLSDGGKLDLVETNRE